MDPDKIHFIFFQHYSQYNYILILYYPFGQYILQESLEGLKTFFVQATISLFGSMIFISVIYYIIFNYIIYGNLEHDEHARRKIGPFCDLPRSNQMHAETI